MVLSREGCAGSHHDLYVNVDAKRYMVVLAGSWRCEVVVVVVVVVVESCGCGCVVEEEVRKKVIHGIYCIYVCVCMCIQLQEYFTM